MIKRGVYCSVKEELSVDVHSSIETIIPYYRHICFYYPNKTVGTYNSDKNWFKLFVEKKFQYAGEITNLDEKYLDFYINDPYNNDKILYSGLHYNDKIEIVARRASAPDVIWFQGIFEYVVGTGEL